MKNKQLTRLSVKFAVFCFLGFMLNACEQLTDESTLDKPLVEPSSHAIAKFVAIPYTNTSNNNQIKYSFTYDDFDYYYIYLGELENIPLYYDDTHHHSWTYSSTTYTISTTKTTTATIADTVTRTSQEAVSIINEHTVSTTTGGRISPEIGYEFDIMGLFKIGSKVNAEENWSKYISDTSIKETQVTTSLTNSIEHGTSYAESTMRERNFILTRDDKEGFYRYTMFSASDVYLYVIKNSKTKEIYYEFKEYVKPGSYYWDLDYSEKLPFKKSDTSSFKFDISILKNLPKPELDFVSYMIKFNANGGTGTMGTDVHGYGIAQNLLKNTFSPPAGYSFAGWARTPSAANAEFSDEDIVLNLANKKGATIELYAIWKLNNVEMNRIIPIDGSLNIVVPSDITTLNITGNSSTTYHNAEIIVSDRTLPLTIKLENINAVGRNGSDGGMGSNGREGRPVIYMGNYSHVPNLTIISSGTTMNRLDGGNGGNGGQGNKNSTGGNGGNGGAAIMADNITIMGDANFILKGGNGGSGGRGGDLGISLKGSSGGNGGNGGASMDANNIANNLVGILYALRGQGGAGGSKWHGSTGLASGGSNGSSGASGVQYTSTPIPLGIIHEQLP